MKLTKPYELLFSELQKGIYRTWTVYDYFIIGKNIDPDKKHVILRVDVDYGLHLCPALALSLKERKINASFYFLTFPNRYYDIWKSDIPRIISDMGFEVGLHTDHYYEQLISAKDAIEGIREDVEKLSKQIGKPIRGMVWHGHITTNLYGLNNWGIYKDIPPEKLGLTYHDGVDSPYTKPGSDSLWNPNTTHFLSDFIGVVGGWNYYPAFPVKVLHKKVKTGDSINIGIHPHNAFNYWENWDYSYGERMPHRSHFLQEPLNYLRVWKMISRAIVVQHLKNYPRLYRLVKSLKNRQKD